MIWENPLEYPLTQFLTFMKLNFHVWIYLFAFRIVWSTQVYNMKWHSYYIGPANRTHLDNIHLYILISQLFISIQIINRLARSGIFIWGQQTDILPLHKQIHSLVCAASWTLISVSRLSTKIQHLLKAE